MLKCLPNGLNPMKCIAFVVIEHFNCINNGPFFILPNWRKCRRKGDEDRESATWNWKSCSNQFCSNFFLNFSTNLLWRPIDQYDLRILHSLLLFLLRLLTCLSHDTHTHTLTFVDISCNVLSLNMMFYCINYTDSHIELTSPGQNQSWYIHCMI